MAQLLRALTSRDPEFNSQHPPVYNFNPVISDTLFWCADIHADRRLI